VLLDQDNDEMIELAQSHGVCSGGAPASSAVLPPPATPPPTGSPTAVVATPIAALVEQEKHKAEAGMKDILAAQGGKLRRADLRGMKLKALIQLLKAILTPF